LSSFGDLVVDGDLDQRSQAVEERHDSLARSQNRAVVLVRDFVEKRPKRFYHFVAPDEKEILSGDRLALADELAKFLLITIRERAIHGQQERVDTPQSLMPTDRAGVS